MIKKQLVLLETNIDDMNPEWTGFLVERLLSEGALDVSLVPVFMKKNRPGTMIQVLCVPAKKVSLLKLLFAESTSLGIRSSRVERYELRRTFEKVKTPYGIVTVKCGYDDSGKKITASPEYESCRNLALKKKVPLKEVYSSALKRVG